MYYSFCVYTIFGCYRNMAAFSMQPCPICEFNWKKSFTQHKRWICLSFFVFLDRKKIIYRDKFPWILFLFFQKGVHRINPLHWIKHSEWHSLQVPCSRHCHQKFHTQPHPRHFKIYTINVVRECGSNWHFV